MLAFFTGHPYVDTDWSRTRQVSLEEKVWECTETKKICFNQQQVDLHKRRVPEAVTWIEKTVADLQKVWKEKQAAGASGAGEVETEEDMLLRAAGKKPKGKGAAGPVGPPTVTKARRHLGQDHSHSLCSTARLDRPSAGWRPPAHTLRIPQPVRRPPYGSA